MIFVGWCDMFWVCGSSGLGICFSGFCDLWCLGGFGLGFGVT